jgi:hypothetical protein
LFAIVLRHPLGRIPPVLARMVETHPVSIGVAQIRFAP